MIRLVGFGQFLDLEAREMTNELLLVSDEGLELRVPITEHALALVAEFVDAIPGATEEPDTTAPSIPDTDDSLLRGGFGFQEGSFGEGMQYAPEEVINRDDDLSALMDAAHGDLGEA